MKQKVTDRIRRNMPPAPAVATRTLAYASRHRAPPPPPKLLAAAVAVGARPRKRSPGRFAAAPLALVGRPSSSSSRLFAGSSLLSQMERYWTGRGINSNKGLVEQLQNYGIMRSKKVAEVMDKLDRGLFVPEGTPAYVDSPMPIGYNATISAPHMHATCLELLENNLQPGMHALDIGSGTGYLTACFAMMVGPQGCAVGVEHIPELVADSVKNVQRSAAAPFLKEGALSLHVGDGRLGWPEHAPYDAIHVGAAAPEIPKALVDQLKPGGRMVIPVGNIFQDLKVVDKNSDGSISVHDETSVRYVPLTSRDAQLKGF
ncbi:protein-L-isoaspartate O-methyltransferase 1-like isoform X2 [Syzygium oleosum]|uniref:protein-L-isoaspartate O-methyltransferase 1-like isoform X2 n=1 Tax=Syzygium oleosum TaxID=219896 RepID=UPI0024B96BD0|nr:protein-L-isoaspartate O-methyltransferase 1-like isoform X2 [Syzygium oleosum]